MIQFVVDPVYTQINGLNDLAVIDALSLEFSYLVPSYRYSFQFKGGGWDGRERLLTKKLKFPSGLLQRACRVLSSFGLQYEVSERISYPELQDTLQWTGPDLYAYQNEVIARAIENKRGMIKACTGSGKTLIISRMVAEYNLPTMIYVVSLDLLGQMKETLESTLGVDVGVVGDNKCDIKQITVCSVWTAGLACGEEAKKESLEEDLKPDRWDPDTSQKKQILEAINNARLVILDEAQFAAANSIRTILKNSVSAAHKFGCTATPWRTNGDDILLEAAFGPRICDISATQLIKEGYLVAPKIAFRDIPPFSKKLPKNWEKVKHEYINSNYFRNQTLVQNAVKLLEMGRRPLMLFREIKHGNALVNLLPPDVRYRMITGSLKTQERNQIKQDFIAGKIDLICASTVYDQGIDIKQLDALVLCGGGKSTAKALQRIGRVIRGFPEGGKKDAMVVDTYDQAHYVKKHSFIRYEAYRTEQAFVVQTGPDMKRNIK